MKKQEREGLSKIRPAKAIYCTREPRSPNRTASVRFPACAVGLDVAQIVDHQDVHDQPANRQGHPPGLRADRSGLHEIRPGYGCYTEEDEDKKIP
jgi:hypothetical protein